MFGPRALREGFARAAGCRTAWVLIAIMAAGASSEAGTSAVPAYTLTDLGVLPGATDSSGLALNDLGQVVGGSGSAAFLYSGGKMIGLTAQFSPHTPGANTADGINGSGQIVGNYSALSASTGWVYSNGSLTYLTNTNLEDSGAHGINASGQVAGVFTLGNHARSHATLYSNGALHDLGTLGGTHSNAFAINNAGTVVGTSNFGPDFNAWHAFVYSGGGMRDLGTLGGNFSEALAIDDAGRIVGDSNLDLSAKPQSHAFLYSGGRMQDLGTLGGGSTARGINDAGQIVGDSLVSPSTSSDRAFLYTNGKMYDLNSLVANDAGYVLQVANAINASGQIAGTAITPSGATHAVLLTPGATAVPLPPAAWAALTAVPLLLLGRRLSRLSR